MTIHVVKAGETVSSIAAAYGVDPGRLASDNTVPPDGSMAVGQTLVIRFPQQLHVVRSGETLTAIAAAHAPRYGSCGRTTGTWGEAELLPGQTLVISYRDEPRTSAVFNGYAYPFIDRTLLDAELPYLSCLSPFTYGISASGGLLPLEADALLTAARQRGTRPVMHLSTLTENGQFDAQRAALVLTDAAAQDRLAEELRQLLLRRGYAGLDVDFEFLPSDLAAPYAAFLAGCGGW